MSGAKGRSGGSNRKSAARHLVEGTFRPCRHGSRKAAESFVTSANPTLDIARFAAAQEWSDDKTAASHRLAETIGGAIPACAAVEFARLLDVSIERAERAADLETEGAIQRNRFGESKPTAAARNFSDADKRYAAALNAYRNAAAVAERDVPAAAKLTALPEKPTVNLKFLE